MRANAVVMVIGASAKVRQVYCTRCDVCLTICLVSSVIVKNSCCFVVPENSGMHIIDVIQDSSMSVHVVSVWTRTALPHEVVGRSRDLP